MTKPSVRGKKAGSCRKATKKRQRKPQSASRSTKPAPSGPKDGYEVGFGRPPKHSQFKPGQSGNPMGRPKGSRNANSMLQDALNKPITARIDGKPKRVSTLHGIIMRLVENGLNGTPSQLHAVIKALSQLGVFDENDDVQESVRHSPQQQAIFENIIRKLDEADDADH